MAREIIFGSQIALFLGVREELPGPVIVTCELTFCSIVLAITEFLRMSCRCHQQVFQNRPQAQRREEGQRSTITITPIRSMVNSGVVTGNVPRDAEHTSSGPDCRRWPASG